MGMSLELSRSSGRQTASPTIQRSATPPPAACNVPRKKKRVDMTKIHKDTKVEWTEENKLKERQFAKGTTRQPSNKEKKSKMKLLKKREYQRLRSMVPSIATNPHVSKVTVIEEAIRYIDHLHSALIVKLRNRGLPQCLQGAPIDVNQLGQSEIRELIRHLVVNPTMPVPHRWMRERNRHIPSYHLTRHRKLL